MTTIKPIPSVRNDQHVRGLCICQRCEAGSFVMRCTDAMRTFRDACLSFVLLRSVPDYT
jgi:hypothetical protein